MGDAKEPSRSAGRKTVLLLGTSSRADIMAEIDRLEPLLARYASVRRANLENGELASCDFDLAVVLGGDGSMLRAAHQMARRQRPIVGVNMGKLGFLADLSLAEFCEQMEVICSGELPVVEHLMYECRLVRGGRVIAEQLGLNEVAVFAGAPFKILEVDLYVDAELATTYSCDGLIVSTPVGSTAHSLSAGGPILRKDLQAFVISPISPHTLTNRPVVDSADRQYALVVRHPHAGTTLVADGRTLGALEPGDEVRIARSESRFQMVSLTGHSYYRTLREKLGWGGRIGNRHHSG